MSIPLWFFYALGTAILWGGSYALSDRVMRHDVSPLFLMFISGLFYFGLSTVFVLFSGQIKNSFEMMFNNKAIFVDIVIVSLCYVFGTLFIYMAINLKNASMANLVEISYPLFTIFFAYILMKEVQVNVGSVIGGILIFCGICVIYLKG